MSEPTAHWSQIVANVGQAVAAAGAVSAAVVATITYRRAKRREAAHWMHEVFQKFQLGPEFDEVKQIFDFQYREVVEPLHAALVASGNSAMQQTEWKTCHLIDRLLNYLEHLVYLSDSGHAKWSDCCAYFEYWLGLLSEPERGALRRYLVRFGYERLTRLTRASEHEYLLLYGSLCRGQPDHVRMGLHKSLEFVGIRTVSGLLYDLGEFPGLVRGPGTVRSELYRIRDISVLCALDEFEEYFHEKPAESLYRRTTVQVSRYQSPLAQFALRPRVIDAWIFFYNQPILGRTAVHSPSWREYKAERERMASQEDAAADAANHLPAEEPRAGGAGLCS